MIIANDLFLWQYAVGAIKHGRLACPVGHVAMAKTENSH